MRTIAADWSLPQGKSGNWLSNLGAKLQEAAVARRQRGPRA